MGYGYDRDDAPGGDEATPLYRKEKLPEKRGGERTDLKAKAEAWRCEHCAGAMVEFPHLGMWEHRCPSAMGHVLPQDDPSTHDYMDRRAVAYELLGAARDSYLSRYPGRAEEWSQMAEGHARQTMRDADKARGGKGKP